jgi:hypothetical protein
VWIFMPAWPASGPSQSFMSSTAMNRMFGFPDD